MKKLLKSSLLALASFALLTGANAKTLENGVLKIATEGTYSPYSYHDKNDALTGYDVEVAREVAKKLNSSKLRGMRCWRHLMQARLISCSIK